MRTTILNERHGATRRLVLRSPPDGGPLRRVARAGFTLIEMMVALVIMALAITVTFATFMSVIRAWTRGMEMTEDMNHGDYVMEQLVEGLRSSFYPLTPASKNLYGFMLDNNGDGAAARDRISWVKKGASLLGYDEELQAGLHRVRVSMEEDKDGREVMMSRAWRPYVGVHGMNPDNLEPVSISGKLVGFNCRVATNRTDTGWEWEDNWENEATNHLPHAVEVTLYLEPLDKGEPPVELKRLVEIPAATLSWTPKK